jgi:subtilase family serine protease
MNWKLSLVPAAALAAAVLLPAIIGPAALHAQTSRPLAAANARTPVQVLDRTAQLIGSYDPAQKLRLVFGLKTPKPDEEQKFLDALYTPGSPDYHKFLTAEEWNERFSPSEADEQALVDWTQSQGFKITKRYANRLLVGVEAPVGQIQKALGVDVNRYELNGTTVFSNDRDPVLPRQLSGIVSSVMGLNSIQVVRSRLKKSKGLTYPDYAEGPPTAVIAEYHADGSRGKLAAAIAERKEKGLTPSITFEGAYEPIDLIGSNAYNSFALANLGHCCNPTNNPGGSPPETSIAIASAGAINTADIDGFRQQYPFLAFNVTVIHVDGSTTTPDPRRHVGCRVGRCHGKQL